MSISMEELQDEMNRLAGEWVDVLEVDATLSSPTKYKRLKLGGGYEIVLVVPSMDVFRGV